ncbi:MAG: hypothetical protein ACR2K3_04490, partial [Nocardioides sp.]
MTRVRRVAAVAITLAAPFLATSANTDAHAATPTRIAAPAAKPGPPTTHLSLHVRGCDSCVVALQHAVTGHRRVWTSPSRKIGADHSVAFTVRTSRTHGMSFLIEAPWAGSTGAVPNLVTRYRGATVDSKVTR